MPRRDGRAVTTAPDTPAATRPRARRTGQGLLLESLLLAAVALFFLNFNPLGAMSVGHRYSQDLVYAWFGESNWLYPRLDPDTKTATAAHPRVVVMIVNDAALDLRGARWPVPIDFHAELLAELEVLKPRAVMLDFFLIDQAAPAATCAFLTAAAHLRAQRIIPYVAVTEPTELTGVDAGDCRSESGEPLVAARVLTPVSVRLQSDGTDYVNRRYGFEQRATGVAAGAGLPSAAVRMYCDFVADGPACLARLTRDRPPDAGFELAWSPAGDPFNQRWSEARCDEVPSVTQAILFKKPLPKETLCPPVPTLFASALLSPAEDASFGQHNEQLLDLVDGAFVFIGGNFKAGGDLMTTPLHTRLPGVYYHAVALDNLLAFHGSPKVRKEYRGHKLEYYLFDLAVLWVLAIIFLRRQAWISRGQPTGGGPFSLSPAARSMIAGLLGHLPTRLWVIAAAIVLVLLAAFPLLQMIAVLLAVAVLIVVEVRLASEGELKGRLRNLALYCAALVLSLVVVAVAIALGYEWLALPPVDWVGYLSFAAFGFFVAHTAILEFARNVDASHGAKDTGEKDA